MTNTNRRTNHNPRLAPKLERKVQQGPAGIRLNTKTIRTLRRSFWIILILCMLFVQGGQIKKLNRSIDELNNKIMDMLVLEDYEYVTANKLILDDAADIWRLPEDEYLVYFYNNQCSYCVDFEKKHLIPFIRENHTQSIKLYFVNMEQNRHLYVNEEEYTAGFISSPTQDDLSIIGTPTMLWVKAGIATAYLGNEEMAPLLEQFKNKTAK